MVILKKINYKFSALEAAWLVWHSEFIWDEKKKAYLEIMNEFEDILTELERKEEELSELRNDIEYNYKPINVDLEFYGMSQNDFI